MTDATRRATAVAAELQALRAEMERAAVQGKEVVQKLERLTLAVGELREAVADLQAALAESDVEYGTVDESDSEMGEGHA
ncbi:MAG TPA: hypothetical protein VFN94_05045 [Nitrospiria bacterium]|nr:hypothetical protein [Nitrospiria bacterium]